MLNSNLDEKIGIVKGDLEEFLEKNPPNLLQLCQLLEPFHHYLQLPFKLKHKYTSNYYIIQKQPSQIGISTRIACDNSGRYDQNCWGQFGSKQLFWSPTRYYQ